MHSSYQHQPDASCDAPRQDTIIVGALTIDIIKAEARILPPTTADFKINTCHYHNDKYDKTKSPINGQVKKHFMTDNYLPPEDGTLWGDTR